MNYLLVAGVLAIVVGLVHSVLGEILIFQRLRKRKIVPTNGGNILTHWHIRILWACWHIMTLFGFALAAFLLHASSTPTHSATTGLTLQATAVAMTGSAAFILFAMRGRHPAWIALLAIAVLIWMA